MLTLADLKSAVDSTGYSLSQFSMQEKMQKTLQMQPLVIAKS